MGIAHHVDVDDTPLYHESTHKADQISDLAADRLPDLLGAGMKGSQGGRRS